MTTATSKQARQEKLASLIFSHGTVRIDALQAEMGTSAMTLYRDLADLERRQAIIRSRGSVSAAGTSLSDTSYPFRLKQEVGTKQELGRLAAGLLKRGDTLFVDESTTSYYTADAALGLGKMTIVTNSQGVAQRTIESPDAELLLIGGCYERRLNSYSGPAALRSLRAVRVDVAILGAASVEGGSIYHPDHDIAALRELAIARAKRSILVLTASKFDESALHEIAPLTEFTTIVTDRDPEDPQLRAARAAGVQVLGPSS